MNRYAFVDYATQAYSALVAVLILSFHNQTVRAWPWLVAAHALGLAAVHWLVRRQTTGRPGPVQEGARPGAGTASSPLLAHAGRKEAGTKPSPPLSWIGPAGRLAPALAFLRHFYPVLLYLWFFCETGWLNRMFCTEYLDPAAIRRDQALFGCQPSVLFMEKLPWLAVSEVFYAAYFSYYVMIVGVGLALFLRSRRQFFHYLSVLSFLFYLCYLIYIFLPIIGPRLFFGPVGGYSLPLEVRRLAPNATYPPAVQSGPFFKLMGWIYGVFEAPGSALPSSHVAVAWCTVYFSFRYLRRIRYPHLLLAFLLTLSTIYCHYHYVVDVLAGLLACALLVPLGNWLYFKFSADPPEFASAKRAA